MVLSYAPVKQKLRYLVTATSSAWQNCLLSVVKYSPTLFTLTFCYIENNHRLRSATPFHIKCHLILRNVGHHVDHIEMAERLKNLFLLAGTLPNAPQTSHLLGNCFHAGHPGWEPTLALVQWTWTYWVSSGTRIGWGRLWRPPHRRAAGVTGSGRSARKTGRRAPSVRSGCCLSDCFLETHTYI